MPPLSLTVCLPYLRTEYLIVFADIIYLIIYVGVKCLSITLIEIALLIGCFNLEYRGPPSTASSAKQSPALQHRAVKSSTQEERY